MSNPFAAASQQVQVLIQEAANRYSRGDLGGAEAVLARLLKLRPGDPDAIHLFALVRAAQGRHAEAEPLFRRSLALKPQQPEVMANLANSLSELGRNEDAVAALSDAIRIKPDFAQAHLNLGHVRHAMRDFAGAERSYRNVLAMQPGALPALQGLGLVLNDAGRARDAEVVHREALRRAPAGSRQAAALEHNLGISLKLQDRFQEALQQFEKADAAAPGIPLVQKSRAAALQQLGRNDEAVAAYRDVVRDNPLDLTAHGELNRLLYRLGRDAEFLNSYDEAARKSDAASLPLAKAQFLSKLERHDEARLALEEAARRDPGFAAVQEGLGATLSSLGEFDSAIAALERAYKTDPESATIRGNLAATFLRAGDPAKARLHAEEAHRRAPNDQHAIALLGLAERALGDPEEERLNDYASLVQVFDLAPPQGYSDMASFNRDLNAFLDRFHGDKREHYDQTLRSGTQSLDAMFGRGFDLVERLRARIDEAVATYIQRMKDDPGHLLFNRRRDGFAYSGSWSSRLRDCGFHTNHIHPEGWISSCYYIALPDAVADREGKQGWIKFGEPNFEMGLKDPVRRSEQPAPGRLVLFPSYMWHGTVPFRSAEARTTIAFDAVPR